MRKLGIVFVILFIAIIAGCSGGRYLELTNSGEEAYQSGNYKSALENSEQIISELETKGKTASGDVYALAGKAAYELQEYDKSLKYLEKAEQGEYSDDNLYLYLSKNYMYIDNLSREITALENYLLKYPNGSNSGEARARLFQTCIESENFELAGDLWGGMDSTTKEDPGNMETWLILNRMEDNEAVCDSMSQRILVKQPENEPALKWSAESHFWKAEESYQYQMKAYKKNRTRKQYSILLKAFKQVNTDFKTSRDYFLKLYEMNPDPEYAMYLGNIFTRLDDEGKANYYKKLAN